MNKKIAIVFCSKTGNTRLMANALKEGIELQKYQADICLRHIILIGIKLKNI